MNLKLFFSRRSINSLIRLNARFLSTNPYASTLTAPISHSAYIHPPFQNPNFKNTVPSFFYRFIQFAAEEPNSSPHHADLDSEDSEEEDAKMNEFLSRFVWIMRGKLTEVYTDHDKKAIDAMLLFIVGKVLSQMDKGSVVEQMVGSDDNLSEDLWRIVWEVSNKVTDDMEKAAKKEKLKTFLQSEEVKEMCKFAGEIGIRGDMLRELRFKFAREKMEETEFYESLEKLRQEEESKESESPTVVENESDFAMGEEQKAKYVSLPTRHGKIKYKIYGLDLSDSKWAEVADRIHESGEILWPQEPKLVSGECKLVTQKILSLGDEDDPSPLLAQWVELLKPSKIDWITLLDQIKEKNSSLYFKVAESILSEESFQADTKDYSKLIDGHVKNNRLEDAERIVEKMYENGIVPDLLTEAIMIQLYCEAGNMDRAKALFDSLTEQGFRHDITAYKSMIMAYMKANDFKSCERAKALLAQMKTIGMKPTKEIYMAVLRSFAQNGFTEEANKLLKTMYFDGFEPDVESCGLMVEAFAKSGNMKEVFGNSRNVKGAKEHFDNMTALGFKHDDWTTSCMITAYEKGNDLDSALDLLLKLEKEEGFEPGILTYTVLLDWLCRLVLVDEAEQVLGKIADLAETPSYNIHVSLLEMYSKTGAEKKTLQQLGVLEGKKDQLGPKDFERIIVALINAGFTQDSSRIHDLMQARGFVLSTEASCSLQMMKSSTSTTPLTPTRR